MLFHLLEIASGQRVWLGANDIDDEGNWKWNGGSSVSWTNWKPRKCIQVLGGNNIQIERF